MGFTVDNLEQTSKGLTVRVLFKTVEAKDFMAQVRRAVKPVMQETADEIAGDAARHAPSDTGALAESVEDKVYKSGTGFKIRTNTRTGSGRTGYGADIEFGDSRIRREPFLYPAYDRGMKRLMQYLRNIL